MEKEFRNQFEKKVKQLIARKTSSHILPEVVVTSSKKQKGLYPVKHKFKGFNKWVSPKRAGNMTVMPGDSEMVFFAPIAAGAAVAASPAISSALGSAVSSINTAGDALAATVAGQRLTSGLNFAANAIGRNKAWPWIDAGLTSIFGAHGIDKVRRGDIHNVGDIVETSLDLMPLTQLARPVANIADKVAANVELYNITRKPVIPEGYTTGTEVGYNYGRVTSREPRTSLKFFERPSKISEAESLGFGKSRGFNFQSGNDLHQFYTLQSRRQTLQDANRKLASPENMGVDETISKNSGAIIDEDGYLMSNGYHYTPVSERRFNAGYGISFGRQGAGGGHNYGLNLGGRSTRVKDLGRESEIAYSRPGANLDRNDPLNTDIVVTTSDVAGNKRGVQILTKGMKDMESGAEFSGDASSTTAAEALSTWLRIAKNKPALREEAMANARRVLKNNEGIDLGTHSIYDPLNEIHTENATMSPDAYSYILRTASDNPDKFHLGYQMNAGNFNSFARNPRNAYMYDIEQKYLDGLLTPNEYVNQFNQWIVPLGGRRAYVYNGKMYKPQPFLIRNKQGGKIWKKK